MPIGYPGQFDLGVSSGLDATDLNLAQQLQLANAQGSPLNAVNPPSSAGLPSLQGGQLLNSAGQAAGLAGHLFPGSGLGGAATPLAYAYAIAKGKQLEYKNADSPLGRGLLSGLGPSISQIIADPKLGLTTALGVPFLNGFIRSDKAAHTKPEWAGLFGGF